MLLMGVPSPEYASLAIRAGVAAVVVDMEHGFVDLGSIQHIVTACHAVGGECLVRMTAELTPWLGSLADLGIDGLILSGARSLREIAQVVERLTLYPEGRRSINPFVAAAGIPGDLAALKSSTAAVRIWAMAETSSLLDEARSGATSSVPLGLTGLMIGPYDLAGELGLAPTPDEPILVQAVTDFARWAELRALAWGMFIRDPSMLEAWRRRSVDPPVVIAGYDRDIWFTAMRDRTLSLTTHRKAS